MSGATAGQAAPFHWHGTMAEFDAEIRRRWIESSERLGLDHGMPNAAAAIAAAVPAQREGAPTPEQVLAAVAVVLFEGDEPVELRAERAVEILERHGVNYRGEMAAAAPAQPAPALAAPEPHAADGKIAGQQACDAFWEAVRGDLARTGDGWDWALGPGVTKGWEAAGRAVETQQLRLAREDRDRLKRRVLELAADLDNSAAATRPSKKSTIEDEVAIALRRLLEPACDKCGIPVESGTRCDQCRQLLADLEDR